MSDEDPYEQEFEDEDEPHYFDSKPSLRQKQRVEQADLEDEESCPSSRPQMDAVQEDEGQDDYYDEDFEDKSPDQSLLKPVAPKTQAAVSSDFFLTGVRGSSKETRRRGSDETRSQAQSSAVIDSPAKAFKLLTALKKENVTLRGELKAINERLNDMIDQKISESNLPLRTPQGLEPRPTS